MFVIANVVLPLIYLELFPFSLAPMFSDAPRLYCEYVVTAPDGLELPLVDFGLHRTYWGNPPVGMGFRCKASADCFGRVPSTETITSAVRTGFARHPALDHVIVKRTVIGDIDGRTVGPVDVAEWRIDRP